jgi:hypothetical protein
VPSAWTIELEELCRPHLVLPHAYGDIRIHLSRHFAERSDRMLLQNSVERLIVAEGILGLQFLDVLDPGRDVFRWLDDLVELSQRLANISTDADVSFFVLIEFRSVDVDVNDLGVSSERIHVPSHAIVKANPRQSTNRSREPHSSHKLRRACRACQATTDRSRVRVPSP